MSVKNGSVEENAEMVLSQPESDVRQAQHQQWYLDENTGTLRTALNDYCLDIIKGESTRFQSMIYSPSDIFRVGFFALKPNIHEVHLPDENDFVLLFCLMRLILFNVKNRLEHHLYCHMSNWSKKYISTILELVHFPCFTTKIGPNMS